MEGEVSADDALRQSLGDSRRRFQRRMQQLLEKYNQPFEDDPLVQMSTLTYPTPQGLRVWGGGLVSGKTQEQIQGSPAKTVGGSDGPGPASAAGDELPAPSTQDLGEESENSGADDSSSRDSLAAEALTPSVPWSPLKDDLRRKYLSQVDMLLQDAECSEVTRATLSDDGGGTDTRVSVVPSLAWPPGPARGHRGPVSEGSPPVLVTSSHPCSADMAIVPRNDSVLWQEASGSSFSSSQSFEADSLCNVTISDLYAGMLCSMSELLSVKPSCVISTKTVMVRGRSARRRPRCRGSLNRTCCGGGRRRRAQRGSRDRRRPRAKPEREAGLLGDCRDFRPLPGPRKAGLESGRAVLEVPRLRIWEELTGTPRKLWPWVSIDSWAPPPLSQEKRVMTLQWLISPVKTVSRPRRPWGEEWHPRELGSRFDKLHQEYCLSPRGQRRLPCPASPASIGTGGPGSPRGLETHQPTRHFCRAKAKSLGKAFENLGKQAVDTGWCPPKRDPSASLGKSHPAWTLGCSEPTADPFQGSHPGMYRKSASISEAISLPKVRSPDSVRDCYNKIKEKFDRLYQKCCQKSPPRTKVPSHTRASPDKASVQVPNQREGFSGKSSPDSGFRGPAKLSSAPQGSLLGSAVIEVHPSPRSPLRARCSPQPRGKRSRSPDRDCDGCGRGRADSRDPFRVVGRAVPKTGEEAGSFQTHWGKKRKEERVSQDGRGGNLR
ncbi:Holliday junction recognition protein [Saccopteryx bilineata]|uniref:Holliday junction recognition protein n=1 Tax=Saccopteryx bilineata TaxID=59482 RepID=UPI00338E7CD7